MANEKVVVRQGLTGGTSSDLDSISYAVMSNNNVAFVSDGVNSYYYIYDSSSSAAENSPTVIKPDDAGANPGRWLLRQSFGVVNENLISNPAFVINQDGYTWGATAAVGTYFLDHWFNDAGSGGTKTISRTAKGTPGVDQEYYFSTTGASQVFWPMSTNPGATIPIDLIAPGDPLTISAKIYSGGSVQVYTGYGSATGSSVALTTSLAGTLDSSTPSITFSANFGGWPNSQSPLAITLVGTDFKDVKVERGTVKTPYVPRTFREELELAEHYFQKTYDYAKAPGSVIAAGAAWPGFIQYDNYTGSAVYYAEGFNFWRFKRMNKQPVFTIYSPHFGTINRPSWYNGSAFVDADYDVTSPLTACETGIPYMEIPLTSGLPNTRPMFWHMVADARY
jgi:hypothetical protein